MRFFQALFLLILILESQVAFVMLQLYLETGLSLILGQLLVSSLAIHMELRVINSMPWIIKPSSFPEMSFSMNIYFLFNPWTSIFNPLLLSLVLFSLHHLLQLQIHLILYLNFPLLLHIFLHLSLLLPLPFIQLHLLHLNPLPLHLLLQDIPPDNIRHLLISMTFIVKLSLPHTLPEFPIELTISYDNLSSTHRVSLQLSLLLLDLNHILRLVEIQYGRKL